MSDSMTNNENNTALTANRMRLSAMTRSIREQSAQEAGDENTLWQEAWSMVASINARLGSPTSPPHPPELLDIDMHDLWHIYWHGAINTRPDSPKLDRLALQIIQIREQGAAGGSASAAVTSDGSRIWTDLPFLAHDMLSHWHRDCAALGRDQRLSGAQFLALLVAAGADDDEGTLCSIALVVLRDALETARPLGRLAPVSAVTGGDGDGDGEGLEPRRGVRDLSIADLLPAANAWLFTAGRKLVALCDAEWDGLLVEEGGLGELVHLPDGVEEGRDYSPERWIWWLRRLEEIEAMARLDEHAEEVGVGGRTLAGFVRGMMDNMISAVEGTSGRVWELLQQLGGVDRYRPAMQRLGPARPASPR